MIIHRIWGKENDETYNNDTVVFLRLIEEVDISGPIIVLCAVDKQGKTKEGWRILRITSSGRWIRYSNVSSKIGFDLNKEGKVVVR